MSSRIVWVFKLLCIGLTLAVLCAAEDGKFGSDRATANANQRPRILKAAQENQTDFDGLEKTLAEYQSAFEAMNLPHIQKVWPGLDRRREAAFRGVFEFLRKSPAAPRLELECAAPTVVQATTTIECREAVTYVGEDSKPETVGPVRVAILLRKESNSWFVESMKGL